jgi:tetratricopeptide (TPR) repeat protein
MLEMGDGRTEGTSPDPGVVRSLIDQALSEDEVRDLCFDHFHQVYLELAAAMSRRECIRRLVAWCYAHGQLRELVGLVAEVNPEVTAKYATRLAARSGAPEPNPSVRRGHPEAGLVHPLPPAPKFVGREAELDAMHRFWRMDPPGVLALLGLGGAGKTALISEFLRRSWGQDGAGPDDAGPDAIFVWSFYLNEDVKGFLEVAYAYFSGGANAQGSPMGTFYLLSELLGRQGDNLLILDGLERMQRPAGDQYGPFGDLTDPLLAQILVRLAAGLGRTKCLVTSRFPLPRLEAWRGRGYASLDIDQLGNGDAIELLRDRGVHGPDDALRTLIGEYGAHALTLDHLGGYLVEYANGDPRAAASLPRPRIDSGQVQEQRLARVMNAYENALSERESALLSRLCVLRSGTTAEQLHSIFATSRNPQIAGALHDIELSDLRDCLQRLVRLHLVLREPLEAFTVHPAIRDHFYGSFTDPRTVHRAVRHHYSALVGSPGLSPPTQAQTLDILEELVYHTIASGHAAEAEEIYRVRLGGYEHLAWLAGQYSRCIRILKGFPRCPDPGGLIWCYRAVGDLTAALACTDPDDMWWAGMIGMLRGRLREVADLLADSRDDPMRAVCEVLTGAGPVETLTSVQVWFGTPINVAECFLYAGRLQQARACVARAREELAADTAGWNDELTRYDLVDAALELKTGDLEAARGLLNKATQWIVASGSQEHLCLLHLGHARLALAENDHGRAETAIREGQRTAEQCGFGLYQIELLIEEADLALSLDDARRADKAAAAALHGSPGSAAGPPETDARMLGAAHPACHFVWGMARAGYLAAEARWRLGQRADARAELDRTIALQQQINDPGLARSAALRDRLA